VGHAVQRFVGKAEVLPRFILARLPGTEKVINPTSAPPSKAPKA
jgi:hypothetical protein